MYKNIIDQFINSNYNNLLGIAKAYCAGTNLPHKDLTTELVLFLYENESKVTPYITTSTSLIRYSKKWLWNQSKVYSKNSGLTNFKSKFQIFEGPEVDSNSLTINDGSDLKSDYEYDLMNIYTDKQIGKIIFTREILIKLTENERRLFYLHYDEMLSHGQIADYLQHKYGQKCSPSSIYNLIVALRIKIKHLYDINN